MTYREYRTQEALGVLDLRKAAEKTKSVKVLRNIVNKCFNPYHPIKPALYYTLVMLIALNKHTPIFILERIIEKCSAYTDIVTTVLHHPKVTISVLETWLTIPDLNSTSYTAFCDRLRVLQVAAGGCENLIYIPRYEYYDNFKNYEYVDSSSNMISHSSTVYTGCYHG